ncbi:hypothetical protein MZD04_gp263 [Pseudomonas phage Psa21]|uniref:Uncharacterized protein n=1 Tax=Pseudomonas phage Psa21 TaxID=2530023 RepID=A0A481W4L3_9CAUD|nr:hypothetical protein MZD04_gp263 [Pseudomonas phage Psa21]QBJ02789.1 hypothetical protein PSA21_263 [Pseudomonas phage Psa21]
MVITHNTITEINEQTLRGLPIGYYGKEDDLSDVPRMLGDWNIRTISDSRCPGTGYIVAVPSNARTRLVYMEGRLTWLKALGFSQEQALKYYRAGMTVSRKWDHEVALFVLNNIKMDEFVLDVMLASHNPKKVGEKYDIYTRSTRGKVLAGCQILKNMLTY